MYCCCQLCIIREMEKAPTMKVIDLPPIPPEPIPPPSLESEEQYGDPFKHPHEITELIRPLLLADRGPSHEEIISAVDRVHLLLVNHVEELAKNNQPDDQTGILLHQTCYFFTCKTPLHYHKMKEWGIWAPTAQEYNMLVSENVIGETETFDPRICYEDHQAQYLSYKAEWTALEKAYREALRIHQKALDTHKEVKQAKEAAEIAAKKALEEKRLKQLAAAECPDAQANANTKNDSTFKVLTSKSLSPVNTLKQ
ncbi:hypothetical protein F5146DRAFT_1006713 [Armillaria mellea]|nr:hypothetical protein F5146DRAFT_1006713 [Armillaria mellea]